MFHTVFEFPKQWSCVSNFKSDFRFDYCSWDLEDIHSQPRSFPHWLRWAAGSGTGCLEVWNPIDALKKVTHPPHLWILLNISRAVQKCKNVNQVYMIYVWLFFYIAGVCCLGFSTDPTGQLPFNQSFLRRSEVLATERGAMEAEEAGNEDFPRFCWFDKRILQRKCWSMLKGKAWHWHRLFVEDKNSDLHPWFIRWVSRHASAQSPEHPLKKPGSERSFWKLWEVL